MDKKLIITPRSYTKQSQRSLIRKIENGISYVLIYNLITTREKNFKKNWKRVLAMPALNYTNIRTIRIIQVLFIDIEQLKT